MDDPIRTIRDAGWGAHLREVLSRPPTGAAAWIEQHTHLLKSDAGSRVGLLQLRRQSCCLKLYRYKSTTQRWLFRMGHGRAVRSFDIACRLTSLQVPVPQARCCLWVPEGMLLLTEGLANGRNLHELWREQPMEDEARQLLQGAGETIARLHRSGYAHGDCKWSNLLWSGGQIYLVDLDAAGKACSGTVKQARDLARFTLNAEELGISPALYELFLASYLQGAAGSRSEVIARMMPILHLLRARHQAKYGGRGQRLL